MQRELLAEGRRRAVEEFFLKRSNLLKAAPVFIFIALTPACAFAPSAPPDFDAGKRDSGPQPQPDSGMRGDAGLTAVDACPFLNANRCAYLARCGLIEDTPQARQECARAFEATWCGPTTWLNHVVKGALKYDPVRAEACGEGFRTQACGEFEMLPDSCTRFLLPRVQLGGDCYDNYTECLDGVCRGSSCPRTCQPRGLLDDPCSIDGDCRTGLYCKLSPFMPNAGQCANFGSQGAPCENDKQCLQGLHCLSQMCRVLPAPGDPCAQGQCAEAAYCDPAATSDGGVCLARKQEGALCAEGECQSLLVCDPLRGTCEKARLSSGEPCSLAQQCPAGQVCLGANARTLGLCMPPQLENAPCGTHLDCQAHLACQTADGGLTCQRRVAEGRSCDSERLCRASASCTGSTCVELPLQGESCAETRVCRWGLCRDLVNSDGGAVCGPLLSAAQPCSRGDECASGSCLNGTCAARCVP